MQRRLHFTLRRGFEWVYRQRAHPALHGAEQSWVQALVQRQRHAKFRIAVEPLLEIRWRAPARCIEVVKIRADEIIPVCEMRNADQSTGNFIDRTLRQLMPAQMCAVAEIDYQQRHLRIGKAIDAQRNHLNRSPVKRRS